MKKVLKVMISKIPISRVQEVSLKPARFRGGGGWEFRNMLGSSETMWSCCFKSHNWKLNYIKPDNRPLEKERHLETRVFYVLSCREIYDIYIYN